MADPLPDDILCPLLLIRQAWVDIEGHPDGGLTRLEAHRCHRPLMLRRGVIGELSRSGDHYESEPGWTVECEHGHVLLVPDDQASDHQPPFGGFALGRVLSEAARGASPYSYVGSMSAEEADSRAPLSLSELAGPIAAAELRQRLLSVLDNAVVSPSWPSDARREWAAKRAACVEALRAGADELPDCSGSGSPLTYLGEGMWPSDASCPVCGELFSLPDGQGMGAIPHHAAPTATVQSR